MSSAKKFYMVILIIMGILVLLSAIMFIVDPAGYYRYDENNIINNRYSMAGIVNHYPHNVEFIGTSMFHNMDMNRYEEANPEDKPLKITVGSMTFEERLIVLMLPRKSDVDTYIIDMVGFFTNEIDISNASEDKYPPYMYNDTIMDDYKYLLGYEPWLKLLPGKLASSFLSELGIADFSKQTDLNRYSMTYETIKYDAEERKHTIKDHNRYYDLEYSLEEINKNVDYFVEEVVRLTDSNDEIIFVYNPFSVLYWHVLEKKGAMDIILETKKMFVQKCSEYDNIRVLDFQSIDEIADLTHYSDSIHHDMMLHNMIIDELYTDTYLITPDNVDKYNTELKDLLHQYRIANADWINN